MRRRQDGEGVRFLPAAASSTVCGDTLAFLREHRGQKFQPAAIAKEVGHDVKYVTRALQARYHDGRYGVLRETPDGTGRAGDRHWYWMLEQVENVESPEEQAILRSMRGQRIAARAVEIAAQAKVEIASALRILEGWCNQGVAVKCELVLREGADRFEYRLAESAIFCRKVCA